LLDDEPVDWAEGVALQLTLLSRDTNGKLTRDGYVEATLRAALFVDLAFDGRIERGEQSWIDCEPVNFAPADRLLTAISRHPDRTLGWWIGKGPKVQHDLANEWVRIGGWARGAASLFGIGRYYNVTSAATAARSVPELRAHLQVVVASEQPDSPRDAGLAALAQIACLVEDDHGYAGVDPPRADLLAACGPVQWMIEETAHFMIDARRTPTDPVESGGG
jgi:Golgi phosphoprotein 3 (GPP34)